VVDTTAPSISVPADAVVECTGDTSSAATGAASGSDTCGSVAITESDASVAGCGNTVTITRTWTATDDCGNSTSGQQTITVVDTTAPSLSVPADATVECSGNQSSGATGVATGSDTCGSVAIAESDAVTAGGCENEWTITRTWTATDECGNVTAADQTITVVDTTNPVLAGVPADTTVECDSVPAPASPTASDNCDGDVTIELAESSTQTASDTCSDQSYTITRVWTATDNCGNSSSQTQVITVQDTTAPAIATCAPDRTIVSSATNCVVQVPDLTGEVVSSDNCDATVTVTQSPVAGASIGPGLTVVTLTATDNCGNSTTCAATLTVLQGAHVAFRSPLEDDNDASITNIPGLIANKVRKGQVVPHKVVVTRCDGTVIVGGVTVKLKVQGLELNGTTLTVFNDVIEDATGVGTDGTLGNDGIMRQQDGMWHFNLDTSNFSDPNTFYEANRFYRCSAIVYDSYGNVLGQEDAILETR